jgi:lysylphosphatidylglycerol synthetase-like protein (DUF2156 family)
MTAYLVGGLVSGTSETTSPALLVTAFMMIIVNGSTGIVAGITVMLTSMSQKQRRLSDAWVVMVFLAVSVIVNALMLGLRMAGITFATMIFLTLAVLLAMAAFGLRDARKRAHGSESRLT